MMAITALIHFSGCALTRPTPNTAPAIPDTFSETGRFTVQSNWWLSLNDDELNALIHESLSESLTLRAARSRLDQFGFLVTKSGANAWPTLDVSGQATHRDNQGQSEDRSFWLRGATSFELDLWGKLKKRTKRLRFRLRAGEIGITGCTNHSKRNVGQNLVRLSRPAATCNHS